MNSSGQEAITSTTNWLTHAYNINRSWLVQNNNGPRTRTWVRAHTHSCPYNPVNLWHYCVCLCTKGIGFQYASKVTWLGRGLHPWGSASRGKGYGSRERKSASGGLHLGGGVCIWDVCIWGQGLHPGCGMHPRGLHPGGLHPRGGVDPPQDSWDIVNIWTMCILLECFLVSYIHSGLNILTALGTRGYP